MAHVLVVWSVDVLTDFFLLRFTSVPLHACHTHKEVLGSLLAALVYCNPAYHQQQHQLRATQP